MKLRNKKTGEHGNYKVISAGNIIRVRDLETDESWQYDCLADFNEEWEDYTPAEPLIKDEKIRKAVRAWAEANKIDPQDIIRFNAIEHRLSWISTAIEFNEFEALSDLEKEDYTIAELCGSEE
jgi:hypothetical protein